MTPLPDDYFEEDYDDWDEEDEWPFDCGMDQHGNCSMAGSEDCEFECPYRR